MLSPKYIHKLLIQCTLTLCGRLIVKDKLSILVYHPHFTFTRTSLAATCYRHSWTHKINIFNRNLWFNYVNQSWNTFTLHIVVSKLMNCNEITTLLQRRKPLCLKPIIPKMFRFRYQIFFIRFKITRTAINKKLIEIKTTCLAFDGLNRKALLHDILCINNSKTMDVFFSIVCRLNF